MRKLRFLIEAAIIGSVLGLARLLPRRVLLAMGSLAGRLAFVLDRRHTRIAVDNLRTAFGPSLPDREARRIAKECWRHFGRILFDALWFPRMTAALLGRAVHQEGLDNLRRAWDRGKGVLLFTAHYGHWELAGLMQGFAGFPLAVVARPLDNPYLERMLSRLRTGSGNLIIHKRSAVREILRSLRSGISVALVIDQDAREAGVFVPFFGRPASTTPTLALVALRTGAPVVPVHTLPLPDGAWRVIYGPEIAVEETGDRDADVLRLTARCAEVVESWVRARPEIWLWMHRRWKTAPREGTP